MHAPNLQAICMLELHGSIFPFEASLVAQTVKASACNAGDLGSIAGLGRSPGEGNGNPTPVLLPGKFHGWRSRVGYSPWNCKESDTAERLHCTFCIFYFITRTKHQKTDGSKELCLDRGQTCGPFITKRTECFLEQ